MENNEYREFHNKEYKEGADRAAKYIVNVANKLFSPKSVIDFGCGVGSFLDKFREFGVQETVGINMYADVKNHEFYKEDLNEEIRLVDKNNNVRKFDLALCLEVAEHIREENSEKLVKSLCAHSDIVIFSAAIPGQGGVGHINEQQPFYWGEIFQKNGFVPFDVMRFLLWEIEDLQYWYKQNTIPYIKFSILKDKKELNIMFFRSLLYKLLTIHPECTSRVDYKLCFYA